MLRLFILSVFQNEVTRVLIKVGVIVIQVPRIHEKGSSQFSQGQIRVLQKPTLAGVFILYLRTTKPKFRFFLLRYVYHSFFYHFNCLLKYPHGYILSSEGCVLGHNFHLIDKFVARTGGCCLLNNVSSISAIVRSS